MHWAFTIQHVIVLNSRDIAVTKTINKICNLKGSHTREGTETVNK